MKKWQNDLVFRNILDLYFRVLHQTKRNNIFFCFYGRKKKKEKKAKQGISEVLKFYYCSQYFFSLYNSIWVIYFFLLFLSSFSFHHIVIYFDSGVIHQILTVSVLFIKKILSNDYCQ